MAGAGGPPTTLLLATGKVVAGRPSPAMTQEVVMPSVEALISPQVLTPNGSDHSGAALGDADHDVVQQVGEAIAAPRLA